MTPGIKECYTALLAALSATMKLRHTAQALEWIDWERAALCDRANEWARTHEGCRTVTISDIEIVETRAMGHCDYASKLALYVAELVYNVKLPA